MAKGGGICPRRDAIAVPRLVRGPKGAEKGAAKFLEGSKELPQPQP